MTDDCRPADNAFTLANAALTEGDHARAIRLYADALLRQPALRDQLGFNLALARRRYRASRRGRLPRIAVCGDSLGTASAGRVQTLADIYQGLAQTEIIGSVFPERVIDIWPPIRDCVTTGRLFRVGSHTRFPAQAMELVRNNPYDIVHLSRPRFPNILIGLLYKLLWDARVIVDIDGADDDLAFIAEGGKPDFDACLQSDGGLPPLAGIIGDEWTLLGLALRDVFDGVTTSNPALQRRFGGILIPHARDAAAVFPSVERRMASRARFGVPIGKTVALWFHRADKVLLSAARALGKLGRDDLWLVVADEHPGGKLGKALDALPGVHLHFVGVPHRAEIPEMVAMGDIDLLVSEDESLIAQYGLPPHLTDALALGVVTFATPGPPLEDCIAHGAIVPTSRKELQRTVRRHLQSPEEMSRVRQAGRSYFLAALSTDACRDVLRNTLFEPAPLPAPGPEILSDHRQRRLFKALGGWTGFADRRIVVYSVLVGRYEGIKAPTVLDPNVRYILFTDNPDAKSDKWEIVHFDTLGLSPRRASRLPKLLAHRYLPDHDVSVYIDASLTIVVPDLTAMVRDCLQGYDIAAYPHLHRDCLYKEIDECVRLGKADETRANALRQRLIKEQYPKRLGLVENAFLVRRDTPVTRRINELWFSEYLSGAERDQFYLMYVLWRAEVPHAVIGDSADFRKGSYVRFKKHRGPFEPAEHEPDGVHNETLGFFKGRDPAHLKPFCGGLLASAPEPEQWLATRSIASDEDASPLDAVISGIVDLEYQREPAGQNYRAQLSAILFRDGARLSADPEGTKLACLADSPMPIHDAGNIHMMKMCSAFAGAGADIVLYAEHAAHGAVCGNGDAINGAFAVTNRYPMRLVENAGPGSVHPCYRLLRQAIEDGCTHVYTRCLDAAVFSVSADIPTILELHAPIAPSNFHKLEFIARSPALEKLVVISKSLIDAFKGIFRGLEEKTVVLHNGSDAVVEKLPPFGLDRSPGAIAHIGYVGYRQSSASDVEMPIALARCLPRFDFHLLVGSQQDIESWRARAADVPNVKVYGLRPLEEVASFIQDVDIAVAPFRRTPGVSDAWHADACFSPPEIFDFMAQGKAIVSSDLPALREVLRHRDNALLCAPDNVDEYAAALRELSTSPDLRRRLGAAARTTLVATYTWETRAKHILELIETRPRLACAHEGRSPARPPAAMRSKPVVGWYRGGIKQEGWAYGINAKRLSSQIPGFDHVVGASEKPAPKKIDVAIAFDVLIMDRLTTESPGPDKTILRVGGPNPLKVFAGGNVEKLSCALSGADAIIALSPQLRDDLEALHPNVCFIPNGIDTEAYHPARRARGESRIFTVGMSASMAKEEERHGKGYYLAKAACQRAAAKLLAVGRGVNQIPHERLIEDFYSRIDVLVHPVGAGKEGSSNVIMEALALGIPVVTTRYAGFHGVALRSGEEGLIVRRTAGDFAAAIRALKDDADLRQRLGRGGRAFVERHHRLELIARQYEAVIWSCLDPEHANSAPESESAA